MIQPDYIRLVRELVKGGKLPKDAAALVGKAYGENPDTLYRDYLARRGDQNHE